VDNNELLNQIVAMLEQQHAETKEEILGVKLLIENQVTQRLDALADGYKLNHDKQWELEREIEELRKRVERLENAS
jgi:polyhydroxyalkanoate synthesis regulator phasin